MVRDQMLYRLVRVIQMVGAILVMMMTFSLPVQRRVFQVSQCVHRRARARHSHRLPEHGKQHDEEEGGTTHRTKSLPNQFPACGQPGLQIRARGLVSRRLSAGLTFARTAAKLRACSAVMTGHGMSAFENDDSPGRQHLFG
jgi:hypothetical protein